ncbi:MAG: hypothetical protein J5725_05040 [Bacteroidales bacterium]|nr:hypothetical protein [Bacteroidales bacterium]
MNTDSLSVCRANAVYPDSFTSPPTAEKIGFLSANNITEKRYNACLDI